MHINNPTILITAEIDKSLLNEMIAKGIDVDVIPFIQTKILRTEKIKEQIEDVLQLNTTVIFTSNNAVEAVGEHSKNKSPNWKIYCIGNTTRSLVEKLFGVTSVVAVAENATDLAKEIISNKKSIKEIYFFCGDKRRNELPKLLNKNNIVVNEIEVYTTTILYHKIEKNYDAILFFSPSVVYAFFENNILNKQTVLFSIGNTTANEIKKFTNNTIIISDKPEKKTLIEKMILFFQS